MESNIFFDKQNHEFSLINAEVSPVYKAVYAPLSVIVQVTRRCSLTCSFCSESDYFEDPSFDTLLSLRNKLEGVKRVYLSGGEPLLRKDIFSLISKFKETFDIVGLPTNSTHISKEICLKLKENVSYINAGLDGARNINNIVRGNYDGIIKGLYNLRDSGIEVSLSTVILKDTLEYIEHVIQIADLLDITKVKMVVPIFRGRAKNLTSNDLANPEDIIRKFEKIKHLKDKLGWKPRVKYTLWDSKTEGYAILIYPNQQAYAWPVYNEPDSVLYLGDLSKESIKDIWERYPYKENHINKYTGISMNKA
ncbi:MAG: radical SAM protein [Candidatus Sericytochromatia bacterium]